MKTYTKEEIDGMRQTIEEQIWFDYIKKYYPVEVDKLINEFSMRELNSASDFLDPRRILKFADVEKLAGTVARDNLKRYFYFLDNESINMPTLNDKDIPKFYYIIFELPFGYSDNPDILLTDILFAYLGINFNGIIKR